MKRKHSQSPQAKWSRKMKARGRCSRCGKERGRYKQLCDFHQGQFAAYMRAYRQRKATVVTQVSEVVGTI